MSGEGAVTESSTLYPVLDTGTVSLDEPDYNQMKEDRRNRTRAVMKVYIFLVDQQLKLCALNEL